MPTILLAEANRQLAAVLRKRFFAKGFAVRVVTDATSACASASRGNFDVMVLDADLPGIFGSAVLESLRAEGNSLPVVLLTTRTGLSPSSANLEARNDEHLCTPFRFDELLAQVRRRLTPGQSRPILLYAGLSLDLRTRRAYIGDYSVDLSVRECAFAEAFLCHPGEVLTREVLQSQVWGTDYRPGSNVVDVYVRYLRGPLGAHWFVALRGVGYRLEAAQVA